MLMMWAKSCRYATTLANTDNGKLTPVLEHIVKSEGIDTSIKARVIYGMDTRCVFISQ